jgi:hypothetical protein
MRAPLRCGRRSGRSRPRSAGISSEALLREPVVPVARRIAATAATKAPVVLERDMIATLHGRGHPGPAMLSAACKDGLIVGGVRDVRGV